MRVAPGSDIELLGAEHVVSYVATPIAIRGMFRLVNHRPAAARIVVAAVWLKIGADTREISKFGLYDLENERSIDLDEFQVDATAYASLLVSVPPLLHEPRFGESLEIGLRLGANGRQLQATSVIVLERRLPRTT
jgi:hypothetical protein